MEAFNSHCRFPQWTKANTNNQFLSIVVIISLTFRINHPPPLSHTLFPYYFVGVASMSFEESIQKLLSILNAFETTHTHIRKIEFQPFDSYHLQSHNEFFNYFQHRKVLYAFLDSIESPPFHSLSPPPSLTHLFTILILPSIPTTVSMPSRHFIRVTRFVWFCVCADIDLDRREKQTSETSIIEFFCIVIRTHEHTHTHIF